MIGPLLVAIALYARHSTDLQKGSTTDQLAALELVAKARGFTHFRTFSDEAISGASLANRPALSACWLERARRVRSRPDRGARPAPRDQEDTAHVFKRLQFHGVVLETLSKGRISELHVGLSGTMNQMFLVELGKKTRRGLVARVRAGFSGGGRCYGYDLGDKGELIINERQAGIIISVFERYAAGESPRTIAHALNTAGEPGPRGGT